MQYPENWQICVDCAVGLTDFEGDKVGFNDGDLVGGIVGNWEGFVVGFVVGFVEGLVEVATYPYPGGSIHNPESRRRSWLTALVADVAYSAWITTNTSCCTRRSISNQATGGLGICEGRRIGKALGIDRHSQDSNPSRLCNIQNIGRFSVTKQRKRVQEARQSSSTFQNMKNGMLS
jgi:hypothetical protein